MNTKKLDFYIQNNMNVLFIGRHGVGKTCCVKERFEANGLKWLYFSAATMDPWVDFIGVPRVVTRDGVEHLDLIRPLLFAKDEIEAIFMDELNRSPKKVRNAVLELLQFKSINGHAFKNLKIIWAAINPEDDEEEFYDVEKLDPAQKDRFHVQIEVPYAPSMVYFKKTFGSDIGNAAVTWWNKLPKSVQDEVSPRRLDYALQMYKVGGDLRDVLPKKANVTELIRVLEKGTDEDRAAAAYKAKDIEAAKAMVHTTDGFARVKNYVLSKKKIADFFLPFVSKEVLASMLTDRKVWNYVSANIDDFRPMLESVRTETKKGNLRKKINDILTCNPIDLSKIVSTWQSLNPKRKAKTRKKFTSCPQVKLYDFRQTTYRLNYLEDCIDFSHYSSSLDSSEIISILGGVHRVLSHSQGGTVNKYKSVLMRMLGKLLKDFAANNSCSDQDVFMKHRDFADPMQQIMKRFIHYGWV